MTATPERILDTVTDTLHALVDAGRPYEGLIPSILDPASRSIPPEPPDTVPGQRNHDRALGGSNLLHDVPLLRTMDALGTALDDPTLREGADRYLETFAERCADTPTGLFPWGEHAYWDLEGGTVGNGWAVYRDDPGPAVHDHLHHVPSWFWCRLSVVDDSLLHEFASGLDFHWIDADRSEFNRHAYLTERRRYPRDAIEGRSCDFPRHSGHFIYDWAVAFADDPDSSYRRQIERTLEYWWHKEELHTDGLLPLESRGYNDEPAPNQTLSLSISLLDAAAVLESAEAAPELQERLRQVGNAYLDAYLSGGDARPASRLLSEPTWASVYGGAPPGATTASEALKLVCAHRHTGRDRPLKWAIRAGETYSERSLPSEGRIELADTPLEDVGDLGPTDTLPIWAFAAGNAIGLLADLYDVTGDGGWATAGLALADDVLGVYWIDGLPRAAGSVGHYENQLGSGYLCYNLARLALLADDNLDCSLPPNYAAR